MNEKFTEWQRQAEELANLESFSSRLRGLANVPGSDGTASERLEALLTVRRAWAAPESGGGQPGTVTGERVRHSLYQQAQVAGTHVGNLIHALDCEITKLLAETPSPELVRVADFPPAALHYFAGSEENQLIIAGNLSLLPPGHRYR